MLVVAFASAPGVPNWGGLLERIRRAMQEPAHKCFDILYVVDAGRSWYNGANHLHSWQHLCPACNAHTTNMVDICLALFPR